MDNLTIHIKFFLGLWAWSWVWGTPALKEAPPRILHPYTHHFLLPWTSWKVLQKRCGWKKVLWSQPTGYRLC